MNTLKRVFLVLLMACAFVTFVMQYDADASARKDVYVTKRMSNVFPDIRTLERFIDVAVHRPKRIKRFMRRNHVSELRKGTRVVKMRSILLDGVDTVVFKVRVPNRNQYGYVLARNLKKVKNNKKYKVKHKVVYKEKHKVVYVEKYDHQYGQRYDRQYDRQHSRQYDRQHDDNYKVKLKAIIETPVLVINLL